MNNKLKYAKYKKKYINLKNKIGGTKNLLLKNIDCESCKCNQDIGCETCKKCINNLIDELKKDENIKSIYRFKLNDVQYIFIGEEHIPTENKNGFYNYLESFLKNNCKFKMDLYMENYLHYEYILKNNKNKIENIYDKNYSGLDNITNLLENSKLCDNININYIDVRNNKSMELYKRERIFAILYSDYFNRSREGYNNILLEIIDLIYEHFNLTYTIIKKNIIERINNKYFKEKLVKSIKLYNNKLVDSQNKISQMKEDYLKLINEDKFDSQKATRFSIDLEYILSIYDSYNLDIYCISKICLDMQNSKNKIRFGYFGTFHNDNIYNLFFKNFNDDISKYEEIDQYIRS